MGMQRRLALRSERIAGMDGREEDRERDVVEEEATAKRRGKIRGLFERRCVTGAEVRELAQGRGGGGSNARVERNIE